MRSDGTLMDFTYRIMQRSSRDEFSSNYYGDM